MAEPAPTIEVWVVEDHKSYGERLMRTLNRLDGIRCAKRFIACEDALAALAEAAATGGTAGRVPAPGVLLLDVELPGMSGIDGIASFHGAAPSMAIVILTVFEDDAKIFRAICAGAAGYLLKTSSIDDIATAIRSAASGGSPITPSIARRVLDMVAKANPPQRDYGLTPREREILGLLVQGRSIKEAASQLGIKYYTADEYIRGVYRKLQVNSRGSAVAKAVSEKLVPPEPRV